jgi:PTH2 family peptidyl-tRNA hydrolase
MGGYKQVIVVRTDIKMSTGKLAAQVAHASVTCVINMIRKEGKFKKWVEEWEKEGQKKIVLQVLSLNELLSIYEKALNKGLPSCLIRDAGLTELEPGTITCVGIGPAPEELVDEITGQLKLL